LDTSCTKQEVEVSSARLIKTPKKVIAFGIVVGVLWFAFFLVTWYYYVKPEENEKESETGNTGWGWGNPSDRNSYNFKTKSFMANNFPSNYKLQDILQFVSTAIDKFS